VPAFVIVQPHAAIDAPHAVVDADAFSSWAYAAP
jgi:hypothetical protein